jgi:hypothetical protein
MTGQPKHWEPFQAAASSSVAFWAEPLLGGLPERGEATSADLSGPSLLY